MRRILITEKQLQSIIDEVYTEKQRDWACWQASLTAKKRKKGLSKKEATEMCRDTELSGGKNENKV